MSIGLREILNQIETLILFTFLKSWNIETNCGNNIPKEKN